MPLFNGTSGDDTINGTVESDTINGFAGNDTIYGFEGDDSINGGDGDDQVYCGDGNDVVDGGAGVDTMRGGTGNDTYVVDNIADRAVEGASAGTDRVKSWVTFSLSANIENLTLIGIAAINGTGNGLGNVIVGNSAANVLNGLGGADTMKGGAGDDTYFVDNAGDRTIEASATDGADLVKSTISFTLAPYLDNLTLIGTEAIDGTGNDLANVIVGNRAANALDGLAGADTMRGGAGDDTYEVENVGDVVIEDTTTGGVDLVNSYVSFALGAYLENLTLLGSAAINGTGNSLANIIIGNGAANSLDGGAGNDLLDGGAGGDTLSGGTGNDVYQVSSASDVIVEAVSQGTDTVHTTIAYTLAANVENGIVDGPAGLALTGNSRSNVLTGGAGADTLVGLTGNDTLIGDAGNDSLNGGSGIDVLNGGTGDDVMVGHLGNDTYFVDSLGDVVTENSGAGTGTDTVNVTISYTLGSNVENGAIVATTNLLTLNGNGLDNTLTGGNGNDVLVGGTGADSLFGNVGNDTLRGAGAASMSGGTGDDLYYVDSLDDSVSENSGEGIDTVRLFIDGYTLTANVENGIVQNTGIGMTLTGNALNNALTGNHGDDTLIGGDGDDVLTGGAGNDALTGGIGTDSMNGGAGDDSYYVDEVAFESGGSTYGQYHDVVSESAGAGTDTVYLITFPGSVFGLEYYMLPENVENATVLGSGTGAINGNDLDNILTSGAGGASLYGYGGNDTLVGGDASDGLDGGAGNDTLYGGGGQNGLSGGIGNDSLYGGTDADSFDGDAGDDFIRGEDGDDLISAGDGNDLIVGGLGQDYIRTGAGADVIVYEQTFDALFDASGIYHNDIIADFDGFNDKISLIGIDADITQEGMQSFHWTGGIPDHTAGDVWLVSDGPGGYYLYADVNGDEFADIAIDLNPFGGPFSIDNLII